MLILHFACAFVLNKQASVPSEITLRFQPAIGKTYAYHLTMEMSMDSGTAGRAMKMKMDSDLDMKAVSREGDVTTIENEISAGKVTLPEGSQLDEMKDSMEKLTTRKAFTTKFDSLYRIKSMAGSGVDAVVGALQNMTFPDHSVKLGETWKSTIDMAKIVGTAIPMAPAGVTITGKIPITFRLEKLYLDGGQTRADINITMKGDGEMSFAGQNVTMHVNSTGTCSLEITTGMTTSLKMESTNGIDDGAMTMTQHMTQTMKLRA